MILTEKVKIYKEKEYFVCSCIKCGSENIKIFDYGYWQGNSGGGQCLDCGFSSIEPCSYSPSLEEKIEIWNNENDVNILIKEAKQIIQTQKNKIRDLKNKCVK